MFGNKMVTLFVVLVQVLVFQEKIWLVVETTKVRSKWMLRHDACSSVKAGQGRVCCPHRPKSRVRQNIFNITGTEIVSLVWCGMDRWIAEGESDAHVFEANSGARREKE